MILFYLLFLTHCDSRSYSQLLPSLNPPSLLFSLPLFSLTPFLLLLPLPSSSLPRLFLRPYPLSHSPSLILSPTSLTLLFPLPLSLPLPTPSHSSFTPFLISSPFNPTLTPTFTLYFLSLFPFCSHFPSLFTILPWPSPSLIFYQVTRWVVRLLRSLQDPQNPLLTARLTLWSTTSSRRKMKRMLVL